MEYEQRKPLEQDPELRKKWQPQMDSRATDHDDETVTIRIDRKSFGAFLEACEKSAEASEALGKAMHRLRDSERNK